MSAAVPKGYKQTKVGIIPEDWEVVKLGEIGDIITGSTPPTNDKNNYGSEYLFVSPVDIKQNKYIVDTEKKVSQKGFKQSRKVNKGSVLFVCIDSTIGKIAIANQDLITNQQINALYSIKYSNELLYYILFFKSNNIKLLAAEQAVPILNKSDFSKILISLPPLKEQEKIAEILTTWDEAISKQEELIKAKEEQKKGLMQKLLSGEVRFSGFSGEWKNVKLGKVAKFYKGKGISKDDLSPNGLPCILYGELYTTYGEKIDKVISKTNINVNELFLSKKNDIIIPASGETAIDIATASCVIHENIALGGDLNVIRTDNNGIFLSYYLNVIAKHRIASIAQGVSVVHLYSSQLENILISIPSTQEQEKIAEVLSLADDEINLLKNELDELKLQKKALMQKLLTGQVRVNYKKENYA